MLQASKIDFVSSPPAVFTYPDEMTAVEHAEWHPGEHITFDQYQKICEMFVLGFFCYFYLLTSVTTSVTNL